MSGDPEHHRSIVDRYLGNASAGEGNANVSQTHRMGATFVSMLDLELGKGQRLALPYSMLLSVRFDVRAGITLRYSTETVAIEGYRLPTLFQAITQHRLAMVGVSDGRREFDAPTGSDAPVVTAIRALENYDDDSDSQP